MRISPLRQRMIGDMTARHFGEKTQKPIYLTKVRLKEIEANAGQQ